MGYGPDGWEKRRATKEKLSSHHSETENLVPFSLSKSADVVQLLPRQMAMRASLLLLALVMSTPATVAEAPAAARRVRRL